MTTTDLPEIRDYIGVTEHGHRMHIQVAPGPNADPLAHRIGGGADGPELFWVSRAVADEFMADDDEDDLAEVDA